MYRGQGYMQGVPYGFFRDWPFLDKRVCQFG